MELASYYKLRAGLQSNAAPADSIAAAAVEQRLRTALGGTGLFHSVELEITGDADRLVIALCGYAPEVTEADAADRLAATWADDVSYGFWSAASTLTGAGQAELLGATMSGPDGHYVTVHVLAQASVVPAPRVAPATEIVAPVPAQREGRAARVLRGLLPRRAA